MLRIVNKFVFSTISMYRNAFSPVQPDDTKSDSPVMDGHPFQTEQNIRPSCKAMKTQGATSFGP